MVTKVKHIAISMLAGTLVSLMTTSVVFTLYYYFIGITLDLLPAMIITAGVFAGWIIFKAYYNEEEEVSKRVTRIVLQASCLSLIVLVFSLILESIIT